MSEIRPMSDYDVLDIIEVERADKVGKLVDLNLEGSIDIAEFFSAVDKINRRAHDLANAIVGMPGWEDQK